MSVGAGSGSIGGGTSNSGAEIGGNTMRTHHDSLRLARHPPKTQTF